MKRVSVTYKSGLVLEAIELTTAKGFLWAPKKKQWFAVITRGKLHPATQYYRVRKEFEVGYTWTEAAALAMIERDGEEITPEEYYAVVPV